jgi:hypothetical protein
VTDEWIAIVEALADIVPVTVLDCALTKLAGKSIAKASSARATKSLTFKAPSSLLLSENNVLQI